MEIRIFISSKADGYNLNITKHRKEETQPNTLKPSFLISQAGAWDRVPVNSPEMLSCPSPSLKITLALEVSVWTHPMAIQTAFQESPLETSEVSSHTQEWP